MVNILHKRKAVGVPNRNQKEHFVIGYLYYIFIKLKTLLITTNTITIILKLRNIV